MSGSRLRSSLLFASSLRRGARALALVFAGLVGCAPKIGDHCTISTDCSPNGDRLCDATQPDGYCTVFNCEPDGCPEESVCVVFDEKTCPGTSQAVRFQRTFCMVTCKGNDQCRSGYTCLDTTNDPARHVVDLNPVTRSICTVPPGPIATDAGVPPICLPPDASFALPDESGAASDDSGAD